MLFEEVGTVNAASLNAGDVGGQSFASNLPRDVDNGRLEELLSKYGKVESVEIVYNEQLDESTGYAIMANETDMNNAIHYLFAWRWKDKEPGLLVYPVNLQVKDPSSNW
ncbi:hypothetical protein TSUD_186660 [Trifolium subterraneum]|uniref:RRM domain-containing protein n=1 Tax=Trifolium subterraneum TaxID=3900 RepID=A0A2Z6P2H4_TRISU|nr:hypothetical protein TSUD_186660 [Trifolium subterraneum]